MSNGKQRQQYANYIRWRGQNHYMRKFSTIAIGMIGWDNLPPLVDPWYLNESLFVFGSVCWFRLDSGELVALREFRNGPLSIYGTPLSWTAYGANGFHVELNPTNSVLMYNNSIKFGDVMTCQYYSELMANIDRKAKMNVDSQINPFLFRGTKEQKASVDIIRQQIQADVPVVVVDKQFRPGEHMEILNFKTEFRALDFNTLKRQYELECLDMLGVDNAGSDKRERLLTGEVTSNNEKNGVVRSDKLKCRIQAVELINEMFGTNIVPYYIGTAQGGEKDGDIYDGTKGRTPITDESGTDDSVQ